MKDRKTRFFATVGGGMATVLGLVGCSALAEKPRAEVSSDTAAATPAESNPASEFFKSLGLTLYRDVNGTFITDKVGRVYVEETLRKDELVEGFCPEKAYLEIKQVYAARKVAATPQVGEAENSPQFDEDFWNDLGFRVSLGDDGEYYLTDRTGTRFFHSQLIVTKGDSTRPYRLALTFGSTNVDCGIGKVATPTGTATRVQSTGTPPIPTRTPFPPATGTGNPSTAVPTSTKPPESTDTPTTVPATSTPRSSTETPVPATATTAPTQEYTATPAPTNTHVVPTATEGSVPTPERKTSTPISPTDVPTQRPPEATASPVPTNIILPTATQGSVPTPERKTPTPIP